MDKNKILNFDVVKTIIDLAKERLLYYQGKYVKERNNFISSWQFRWWKEKGKHLDSEEKKAVNEEKVKLFEEFASLTKRYGYVDGKGCHCGGKDECKECFKSYDFNEKDILELECVKSFFKKGRGNYYVEALESATGSLNYYVEKKKPNIDKKFHNVMDPLRESIDKRQLLIEEKEEELKKVSLLKHPIKYNSLKTEIKELKLKNREDLSLYYRYSAEYKKEMDKCLKDTEKAKKEFEYWDKFSKLVERAKALAIRNKKVYKNEFKLLKELDEKAPYNPSLLDYKCRSYGGKFKGLILQGIRVRTICRINVTHIDEKTRIICGENEMFFPSSKLAGIVLDEVVEMLGGKDEILKVAGLQAAINELDPNTIERSRFAFTCADDAEYLILKQMKEKFGQKLVVKNVRR